MRGILEKESSCSFYSVPECAEAAIDLLCLQLLFQVCSLSFALKDPPKVIKRAI